jgi:hypothetical protein
MEAKGVLPEDYRLHSTLDLTSNPILLIGLNLVGLILLFVFWGLFQRVTLTLRPGLQPVDLSFNQGLSWFIYLGSAILAIVAHEAVHGLFFWIFRARPVFGFRGAYAYAAAPDWFLPRDAFLLIGLAPFLTLTTLGLAGLATLPDRALPATLVAITINAAGAVGDLAVVVWLTTFPREALIQDVGDIFSVYTKEGPGSPTR